MGQVQADSTSFENAAPAPAPNDIDKNVGIGAWYTLFVLTCVYTLAQIDRKVISIVAEPIKHELQLSDSQLGALTGLVFGIPNALMLLPMGLLLDRYSRKTIIAGMLAIWSTACAATGFAGTYLHLMFARGAVGAAESAPASGCLSIIADIFPARLRPVATSLFQGSTPIAAILCFTVITWVAVDHGWRWAFFAAGLPGLAVCLLLLLTVREPLRGRLDGKAVSGARASLGEAFRFVYREKRAFHYVVGPALVSSGSSGLMLWLPSFLMRERGMTMADVGYLLAITSGVVTAVALAASGPLAARFAGGNDRKLALVPIFTVSMAAISALFFLTAGTNTTMIAGIAVFTIFNTLYLSLGYTLLLAVAPPHMRGTVLAIELIAANLLGYAGGPFFVGILSDTIGGPHALQYALTLTIALYVWGTFHFYLGYRSVSAR